MTQYLDFEGLKEFKKKMDSKISSIPGASVSPKFTAITVATEDKQVVIKAAYVVIGVNLDG